MASWSLPTEMSKDAVSNSSLLLTLFGLYLCEWLQMLEVDWRYASGREKFRWLTVFYFLNRHFLMVGLTCNLVALIGTTPINFQTWYNFTVFFCKTSLGLAHLNVSLRIMDAWSQKRYVVPSLFAANLLHVALLLGGAFNRLLESVAAIYTTLFDLLLLVLLTWMFLHPTAVTAATSQLEIRKSVHVVDLVSWGVVFLANIVPTILMQLHLNAVIVHIGAIPAVVASTIVACRIVLRWQGVSIGECCSDGDSSMEEISTFVARRAISDEDTSFPCLPYAQEFSVDLALIKHNTLNQSP